MGLLTGRTGTGLPAKNAGIAMTKNSEEMHDVIIIDRVDLCQITTGISKIKSPSNESGKFFLRIIPF
jgi:hypothetical protein